MKVAITGAHGTGKTTLLHALVPALGAAGLPAQVLPEVPRLLTGEAVDTAFFRRENNTITRQCLIIARQLEVEGEASSDELVLCDRTLADHWAYTRHLFPEWSSSVEGKLWASLIARWLQTYSCVFYLSPEFGPKDDGVREADVQFQADIDTVIRGIYRDATFPVYEVSGTVDQRVAQCVALIAKLTA